MLLLQLLIVILATVLLIRSVNHDKRISSIEVRLKHAIKEINRSIEREIRQDVYRQDIISAEINNVEETIKEIEGEGQ